MSGRWRRRAARHLVVPHLAMGRNGARYLTARTLARGTGSLSKPRRVHPRLERLRVSPPGHHHPPLPLVGRAQQLEPLEAFGVVYRAGSRSEPMGELVARTGWDSDGVDLDRGHASRLRPPQVGTG